MFKKCHGNWIFSVGSLWDLHIQNVQDKVRLFPMMTALSHVIGGTSNANYIINFVRYIFVYHRTYLHGMYELMAREYNEAIYVWMSWFVLSNLDQDESEKMLFPSGILWYELASNNNNEFFTQMSDIRKMKSFLFKLMKHLSFAWYVSLHGIVVGKL